MTLLDLDMLRITDGIVRLTDAITTTGYELVTLPEGCQLRSDIIQRSLNYTTGIAYLHWVPTLGTYTGYIHWDTIKPNNPMQTTG